MFMEAQAPPAVVWRRPVLPPEMCAGQNHEPGLASSRLCSERGDGERAPHQPLPDLPCGSQLCEQRPLCPRGLAVLPSLCKGSPVVQGIPTYPLTS